MKRPFALRIATWILSRVVPEGDREPLIGDLEEEYALRVRADSTCAPLVWYLWQTCSSMPPVLGVRLSRGAWFATLSVALAAYFAVGFGQVVIYWAMQASSTPTYSPLGPIVTFPVIVLIGYCAERYRRGAAVVLGAMMLLVITAVTVLTTENVPLWYRVAYFLVGPVGAAVGGAFSRRHR